MGQGDLCRWFAADEVKRLAEGTIKAVLFDLGDTLLNFGKVRTAKVFRQSARLTYDYLISCGQPAGDFGWYRLRNLIAIQLQNLWANIISRDFDAMSLLKKSGTKRGYKLTDEQWRQVGWLWYEPLSKLAKIEPTLKETLATLKKMGLKLGILTNTFVSASSLDRHLAQVGILDFFPCRLYSYQFEFRKPDKRIFQAAIEKMSELAENILFVGDRLDKDIRPALKAGMRAALKSAYTNAGKTPPANAFKIDRIAELPAIIEKVNGIAAQPQRGQRFLATPRPTDCRGGKATPLPTTCRGRENTERIQNPNH